MALALFLARLLGSSRSSIPRSLPPVLCGNGTGPGLSRLGVRVCLHIFEMLSVLFPRNIG